MPSSFAWAGGAMVEVIFSFDTEDFVTPESDDVLLAIAETLTRHGVRASFAVVGDKARALWARGRRDVVEAVAKHDVQYHANTHLIWPRTTVELSRMDWDDGVDLVMQTERHGLEDVAEAFGQRPVAWVRCGGNWDPRLLYGLNLLGVKAYVPSQFTLPNGGPVWYVNTLNYRYTLAIERYFPVERSGGLCAELGRQKEALASSGAAIVAYAHPCMFATTTFYDLHNQLRPGVFRPKGEWRPAPLLERGEVARRLSLLEDLVRSALADPEIEVITHSEFIRRREEPRPWLERGQLRQAALAVRDRLDYVAAGAGYLSASDVFGALSLSLARYAETGVLPDLVPVRRLLGPAHTPPRLKGTFSLTAPQVAQACLAVEECLALEHRLPARPLLGGREVSPAAFLLAMVGAYVAIDGEQSEPVSVSAAPAYPRCQADLYREVRVRSSELPDDFEEGTIVTHTHLQTWSTRPAVRL